MNQEEITRWADCGHEGCAEINRERGRVAEMLGIQQFPGGTFMTADPEAAVAMIRFLSDGHEGLAKDVVSQLEELANRGQAAKEQMDQVRLIEGELAVTIKGGRVEARKVGRRSFWQAVKAWVKSGLG
jgi:hypothetical protein